MFKLNIPLTQIMIFTMSEFLIKKSTFNCLNSINIGRDAGFICVIKSKLEANTLSYTYVFSLGSLWKLEKCQTTSDHLLLTLESFHITPELRGVKSVVVMVMGPTGPTCLARGLGLHFNNDLYTVKCVTLSRGHV